MSEGEKEKEEDEHENEEDMETDEGGKKTEDSGESDKEMRPVSVFYFWSSFLFVLFFI